MNEASHWARKVAIRLLQGSVPRVVVTQVQECHGPDTRPGREAQADPYRNADKQDQGKVDRMRQANLRVVWGVFSVKGRSNQRPGRERMWTE